MTQPIELRIPNSRPFHGVARLVVGGLAARHSLSYEALEDLQLALVTVLEGDGYAAGPDVRVQLEMTDEAVAMAIGPVHGDRVRSDLEQQASDDLGLGRLLQTLVESAEVEARADGEWLRLAKRVRGMKKAGANA